jgi:hypothetical protein
LYTKAEETVLCFSTRTAHASPWEKRGVNSEPNLWSSAVSCSRLRLNETGLEDALQTELQPELLGLERLRRYAAMGAKHAAKAAEEMKDPHFLAKTFMTCLPVTGFDERKQQAQAEVGGVQQQAREGELLKTARRRQ